MGISDISRTMNVPPYEFCAHKFLDLWRDEEPLHNGMQGTPSADQVMRALKHFKVSRTFKGLSDAGAEQISGYLVEASSREGTYPERVTSLAERFREHFGQFNLSAASKLLWLRDRSPYLIYDARAVTALRRLGNKRFDSYASYYEAWQREYNERSGTIAAAAHGLVDLPREYTAAFLLTDSELSKLVHEPWFCERVFDIYLWEVGVKRLT
jgi:hypothetical protein